MEGETAVDVAKTCEIRVLLLQAAYQNSKSDISTTSPPDNVDNKQVSISGDNVSNKVSIDDRMVSTVELSNTSLTIII